MNRIEATFRRLKKARTKAFIAFITAGYPDLATTEKLVLEFGRRGVDIIELGIPFSDPLADGPVIQEASQRALKKGMTLVRALAAVKRLREKTAIPICFMSYYNPIFIFGEERFFRAARTCGLDGVIVPDLPFEEAKIFTSRARKYGIDNISFVSPTTNPARMKAICAAARGFLYYISTTGVTGARSRLPRDLAAHLRLVKRLSRRPVCVGFGVSTRAQVKDIQRSADGVIVGSAIVRTITRNAGRRDLVRRAGAFVSQLTG